MEIRNNIKIEIIKQGYNSVMSFCEEHSLDYRKINRVINNKAGSFHLATVLEICEALKCDVGDLFYIQRKEMV
jgi:DNA-binding Xre family transcriptional regulator